LEKDLNIYNSDKLHSNVSKAVGKFEHEISLSGIAIKYQGAPSTPLSVAFRDETRRNIYYNLIHSKTKKTLTPLDIQIYKLQCATHVLQNCISIERGYEVKKKKETRMQAFNKLYHLKSKCLKSSK
jgi:hypothetical protein